MFWSIDSCQNRVPANQYHLIVSRAQVSTHRKLAPDAKIQPVVAVTGKGDSCFWLFLPCSSVGHALRLIFTLWLVKIWQVSSCGNICSILNLAYFDSWSWQSFVSTCDVFNCLFPLDVQNEIQLLSGVFCYSWLVCLLGFWLRNASLVKVGNPISESIVFVFTLLDA